MRPMLNLITSVMLGLASALSVVAPCRISPFLDGLVPGAVSRVTAAQSVATDRVTLTPISDWQPIGLSLLRPYVRGKIPAVLIHGLGATPESWAQMIDRLEANPVIRNRYQFWTFGYATGQPILYSASLLRQALRQARERYDPGKTDRAFDQMVLVGYSMGGILARVMARDSRSVLWEQISDQPVEKLRGPSDACDALRQSFFFKAVPEVHRIIYIATPHRGSQVDQGALHWLASQLNQPLETLRKLHSSLVASNAPEFFRESFRQGLSSSVDQLEWEHPRLMAIDHLGLSPEVQVHSVIADVNDPPSAGGTDGVVSYASSHLDNAKSEVIVHSGHLCLGNPQVIDECARILTENLSAPAHRASLTGVLPGDKENKSSSVAKPDLPRQAQPDRARAIH
jgi:pimeloyl-ACP methyl ester carboxylesterase